MKNQKLKDLSKKVTQSQVTSLNADEVKTISGGYKELTVNTCPGENGCWGFSAPSCGAKNDCWSY